MGIESERTEIEELFRRWHEAVEGGDVDAFLNLFADDFVFKPVGRPPLTDKPSCRKLLDGFYGSFTKRREYRLDEIHTSDAWGWVRMSEQVTLVPNEDGQPETHPLTHLMIVARQTDGSWKVARAVSSLDHE